MTLELPLSNPLPAEYPKANLLFYRKTAGSLLNSESFLSATFQYTSLTVQSLITGCHLYVGSTPKRVLKTCPHMTIDFEN